LKRIIKTIPSIRQGQVGKNLRYITYEGEETPEPVLNQIRFQNNSHPFLAFLYHEARKADRILELGIGPGRSTKALLFGCKHGRSGHLWSIDWGRSSSTHMAVQDIGKIGLAEYFTWMQRDAEKIPVKWYENNKMDLIWIDIDDANYPLVVRLCVAAMHEGSKLLLHNIHVGRGENEAISKYASLPGFDYEEIDLGHGLGILTKTSDNSIIKKNIGKPH